MAKERSESFSDGQKYQVHTGSNMEVDTASRRQSFEERDNQYGSISNMHSNGQHNHQATGASFQTSKEQFEARSSFEINGQTREQLKSGSASCPNCGCQKSQGDVSNLRKEPYSIYSIDFTVWISKYIHQMELFYYDYHFYLRL